MINSTSFSHSQLDGSFSSSGVQGEDYPSVSGHHEFTPTNNRYNQEDEHSFQRSSLNGLERSFGGLSTHSMDANPNQLPIGNNDREPPFQKNYDYMTPYSRETPFGSPLRYSSINHQVFPQQHETSLRSSYSGINNIHTRQTSPKYQPLLKSMDHHLRSSPTSSISSCPASPITKERTNFIQQQTASGQFKTPKSSSQGLAHHFSTPTNSYVKAATERGIPLCKIHQLPVDILCKDCSELICAKCSRSSVHNSHNCQLIEDMDRDKECRDVRSTVEMLESRVSKIEQACGTTYELDLMSRQHEEAIQEIRRDFDKAREYLYRKEQELIEALSMIVQSRIQFSKDVNSTKKKLEETGSMYPTESISNYDIAYNKYSTVSSLKEKVEFLEIKLKFNSSCIDQDGRELQQKAQEVSSKISELNNHFNLEKYSYYGTLRAGFKEM